MTLNLIRTAAALVAGSAALAAQADTVKLTGFTFDPATSVSVGAPNYSGQAGQFTGTLNGNSFVTYCTDLLQNFSFGTTYNNYVVVDGATAWGAQKATDLSKLMSAAIASSIPTNAAQSAAVQAAVWEVLYESSGSYDLGSGSFKATSADGATQGFINAVNWAGIMAGPITHQVDQLYHRERQDFLVMRPVPEPGTYAMLATGLAVLGFVGRRRARKA